MKRRRTESFDYDFNPTLYGKRVTIKKFINDAVSYFLSKGTVPTLDEIEDYVTADRYVKANIYDRQFGRAKDGFEFVPLDDLCKNIQNLVSFSQDDDMYESKLSRIRLRITEAASGDRNFVRYLVPSNKATEYLKKDQELKKILETIKPGYEW